MNRDLKVGLATAILVLTGIGAAALYRFQAGSHPTPEALAAAGSTPELDPVAASNPDHPPQGPAPQNKIPDEVVFASAASPAAFPGPANLASESAPKATAKDEPPLPAFAAPNFDLPPVSSVDAKEPAAPTPAAPALVKDSKPEQSKPAESKMTQSKVAESKIAPPKVAESKTVASKEPAPKKEPEAPAMPAMPPLPDFALPEKAEEPDVAPPAPFFPAIAETKDEKPTEKLAEKKASKQPALAKSEPAAPPSPKIQPKVESKKEMANSDLPEFNPPAGLELPPAETSKSTEPARQAEVKKVAANDPSKEAPVAKKADSGSNDPFALPAFAPELPDSEPEMAATSSPKANLKGTNDPKGTTDLKGNVDPKGPEPVPSFADMAPPPAMKNAMETSAAKSEPKPAFDKTSTVSKVTPPAPDIKKASSKAEPMETRVEPNLATANKSEAGNKPASINNVAGMPTGEGLTSRKKIPSDSAFPTRPQSIDSAEADRAMANKVAQPKMAVPVPVEAEGGAPSQSVFADSTARNTRDPAAEVIPPSPIAKSTNVSSPSNAGSAESEANKEAPRKKVAVATAGIVAGGATAAAIVAATESDKVPVIPASAALGEGLGDAMRRTTAAGATPPRVVVASTDNNRLKMTSANAIDPLVPSPSDVEVAPPERLLASAKGTIPAAPKYTARPIAADVEEAAPAVPSADAKTVVAKPDLSASAAAGSETAPRVIAESVPAPRHAVPTSLPLTVRQPEGQGAGMGNDGAKQPASGVASKIPNDNDAEGVQQVDHQQPREEFVPVVANPSRPADAIYEPAKRSGSAQWLKHEADKVRLVNNGGEAKAAAAEVVSYDVETYVVLQGDSFDSIAESMYKSKEFGSKLARYNRSREPSTNRLQAGSRILIPPAVMLRRDANENSGINRQNVAERGEKSANFAQNAPEKSPKKRSKEAVIPPAPSMSFPESDNGLSFTKAQSSEDLLPGAPSIMPEKESAQAPRGMEFPQGVTPPPVLKPAPEATSAPAKPAPTYTVSHGRETLFAISRKTLGDGNRWREIYELNQDRISNPFALTEGVELRLPSDAKPGE